MKFLPTCLHLLIVALIISSCGSSKPAAGTESFINPGYLKKKYTNILVLGNFKDAITRKRTETALSDLLNRSGYKSEVTYNLFSVDDLTNRELVKTKLEAHSFDAVLVLTYLGAVTKINEVVSSPSGTPVTTSSFFDLYLSPTYEFNYDTQSIKAGNVYATFYTREKYEKQWGSVVQVNMSNGLEMGSEMLAGGVLARMKRDKIL